MRIRGDIVNPIKAIKDIVSLGPGGGGVRGTVAGITGAATIGQYVATIVTEWAQRDLMAGWSADSQQALGALSSVITAMLFGWMTAKLMGKTNGTEV